MTAAMSQYSKREYCDFVAVFLPLIFYIENKTTVACQFFLSARR
jgi:hypothetical protein